MANVTYTVNNKNGSYDGDMVVKQYTSINIRSDDTVTVDQPNRGLMILCKGDCIINGTLSMMSKGGNGNPTISGASDSNIVNSNGLQMAFKTSNGTSSWTPDVSWFNGTGTLSRTVLSNFKNRISDGTIVTLVRQGANGGSAVSASNNGNNGTSGTTGQSGGGGSGGAYYSGVSGSGSYGSCWSGGSGGGGLNSNGGTAGSATAWGGAGGNAYTNHSAAASGGAGNSVGGNVNTSGASIVQNSPNGAGGLIILIVGGNLTIGSTGVITANGGMSASVSGGNGWNATGGAAGGGNILIAYRGTFTNNGSITANGGIAGTASGTSSRSGGNGGNGSVQILKIL